MLEAVESRSDMAAVAREPAIVSQVYLGHFEEVAALASCQAWLPIVHCWLSFARLATKCAIERIYLHCWCNDDCTCWAKLMSSWL